MSTETKNAGTFAEMGIGEKEKLIAGDRWKEMGLVFTSSIGTPIGPRKLLTDFKKLLQQANLPEMRFHDLRHKSIALALNKVQAPIKEAQRRRVTHGHQRPWIYMGEKSYPSLTRLLHRAWMILSHRLKWNSTETAPKKRELKLITTIYAQI